MVRLAVYILGSCLAFLGAASPVIWQHQYDVAERSPTSQETSLMTKQSFSSRSMMSRTTHSPSCTVDSFANVTSFVLREYQLETVLGPGNSTQFRGTFAVENPGSGDTYRLYHIPVSIGGGVWSVCRAGEDAPLPAELVICQYLLERRNRRIGFRFEWDCDGKDSDHPYATLPPCLNFLERRPSPEEEEELTCPNCDLGFFLTPP